MGQEEEVDGAAETESLFEPLTAPGPLSRDDLDAGDDLELWIVRVPPQVGGRVRDSPQLAVVAPEIQLSLSRHQTDVGR